MRGRRPHLSLTAAFTYTANHYIRYVVDSVHYGAPGKVADYGRGAPARIRSALRARHGFVATPPSASRASAMTTLSTRSAAATEIRANSYDSRSRTLM